MIDEIQDELRREDWLLKLKKSIPWIALLFVCVLMGTGGWIWYQARQERLLVQDEVVYQKALDLIQEKRYQEARDLLVRLEKSPLHFLALCHRAQCDNQLFLQKPSPDTFGALEKNDQKMLALYPSSPLRNLLMCARTLSAVGQKNIPHPSIALGKESVWYPWVLADNALNLYSHICLDAVNKNNAALEKKELMIKAFDLWLESNPKESFMHFLARWCSLGIFSDKECHP